MSKKRVKDMDDKQRRAVFAKMKEPKPAPQLTYLNPALAHQEYSAIPEIFKDEKPRTPALEPVKEYEKGTTVYKTGKSRPGPTPTKSLGTTKRSIKVSFYVPSTIDGDRPINDVEFQNRINETETFLRKTFGGTTSVRGSGTWVDRNGKPVKEQVAIVETSVEPVEYRENKEYLVGYARAKRTEWGQDIITVEMEDSQHHRKQEGMHFIE